MTVGYFSSEIAVESGIPTYSGGLGVLAGDTMRAAADAGDDVVAVTLLYPQGYATQQGLPQFWKPEDHGMRRLDDIVAIPFDGSRVEVGAWQYDAKGVSGNVPVIMLTTDTEGNEEWARGITAGLYRNGYIHGSSTAHLQQMVLGIGGLLMLQKLGFDITKHHLNEGHSSMIVLEQLRQSHELEDVIAGNTFFNHSVMQNTMPRLSVGMLHSKLGDLMNGNRSVDECVEGSEIVANRLCARHSSANFGVSLQHAEVLNAIFPNMNFGYITNAVHPPTWVSADMAEVYDRHLVAWRTNPAAFLGAAQISPADLWKAHMKGKAAALAELSALTGMQLSPDVYTVGFARRATLYKRHDLVLNPDFIGYVADNIPFRMQFIMAGKPHPNDDAGRHMLENAVAAGRELTKISGGRITFAFVPDYSMDTARLMLRTVDGWQQNPENENPASEACATSGMKAALNGIPHISNPAGWWYEAPRIDRVTGWTFATNGNRKNDAIAVVTVLGRSGEFYYSGRQQNMMPFILSGLGPLVHSERMLAEYRALAWKSSVRKSNMMKAVA
ncbi:alpha-glucan family phosphorylase [Candidatus Woesearchaeota archaeon]|nr:alpha-glucan family phosphorylase [Candidatus Woesearchaeota archaeon]